MRRVTSVVAALVVVAASSGCSSAGIDTASLVGEYVSASTEGRLTLSTDGTFVASAVPSAVLDAAPSDARVDLSGTWELLEMSSTDVVYLSIDEITGSPSRTAGVQLYVSSNDAVYFRPDPDSGTRIAYERRAAR